LSVEPVVASVRGVEAPLCGRVSMDQLILDVTDVPGAQLGDEVELISPDPASRGASRTSPGSPARSRTRSPAHWAAASAASWSTRTARLTSPTTGSGPGRSDQGLDGGASAMAASDGTRDRRPGRRPTPRPPTARPTRSPQWPSPPASSPSRRLRPAARTRGNRPGTPRRQCSASAGSSPPKYDRSSKVT